nr:unnamed protein product [Digitaria exilis]
MLRVVCYYYDPHISYIDYGEGHSMVPDRVAMTHALLAAYGLLDDMDHLHISPATKEDLKRHHLGVVTNSRTGCTSHDNPVIDDLWDYCLRYAGGSLAAARALIAGNYKVAINWSGGTHHAGDGKASGFCYVNDVVVTIKALLERFGRILYVDIDAHHGDGVQDVFVEEARVMTMSFHQYDGKDFFPGTGGVGDVGVAGSAAVYRTLNVPLEAGTGDVRYHKLFKPIMERVMEVFRPDAVVQR